jgi:hypothetical protein
MNISFRDKPVFFDSTTWITDGVITTFPEGQIVVTPRGNLGVGPGGNFQYSANRGPYEIMTPDPALNVLRYTSNGCPMAVVYCAR